MVCLGHICGHFFHLENHPFSAIQKWEAESLKLPEVVLRHKICSCSLIKRHVQDFVARCSPVKDPKGLPETRHRRR